MYRIFNKLDGTIEHIENQKEAEQRLSEIKTLYMNKHESLFSIIYEEQLDNGCNVWRVSKESDSSDGIYHVFNPLTGLHEKQIGLENAISRQKEIKQEFVEFCKLDAYDIVDSILVEQQENLPNN